MRTVDFRLFAAITAISAFSVMGASFLSPFEVRFLGTLTENPALVGLTFSVGAIFFAILSFVLGRSSVRFGKRRIVFLGTLLGIVYPLLYAASASIYQYMGVKVVWAFSGAAMGPILMALLQDTLEKNDNKGRALGIFHSAGALAGSFGAFLGGYASETLGFITAYRLESIIFIMPAIIAIVFLGTKDSQKSHHAGPKRSIFFAVKYLLARPALRFHIILQTAFAMSWHMKPLLFPLSIYALAKSDMLTGSVFASMGIIAMIVLPLAGSMIDKKGFLPCAKVAYVILGISSLGLALSPGIYIFWAFAVLYALGEAINGPMRNVIEMENIENKYRGEILGFYSVYDSVIAAISPLMAGALLLYFSAQEIIVFYSALLWIGLLVGLGVLKSDNGTI